VFKSVSVPISTYGPTQNGGYHISQLNIATLLKHNVDSHNDITVQVYFTPASVYCDNTAVFLINCCDSS